MKPDIVTEGEFKGWQTWTSEAFEHDTAGPFYFRTALFCIAQDAFKDGEYGLTVAFTSEFLSGAKLGQLIEARGEVLREGGSLIFVRGVLNADGKPCLNYSATLKRIKLRE